MSKINIKIPNIDLSKIEKKYFFIVPLVLLLLILPMCLDRREEAKEKESQDRPVQTEQASEVEVERIKLGDGENVIIVDHEISSPDIGSEKRKLVVALWRDEEEMLYDATRDFERINQNVQVVFKEVPFDSYMNNIKDLVDVRGDIDVFLTKNTSQYAKAADRGIAMDVDQDIRIGNIDMRRFGRAFEELRVGGRFFGLPYKRDIYMLFYNKGVLDMAGVNYPVDSMTWNEYRQYAMVIRARSGSHRIFGAFVDKMPQAWYLKAIQMGGSLTDQDLDRFESALEYRRQLEADGSIRRYGLQERLNMHFNSEFQRGETGMHVSGSWHVNQLLESSIEFDWGVASAPHPQNANPDLTIGNYSVAMVSSTAREPEIAFEYIKFLASRDGAIKLAQNLVLPGYMDERVVSEYVQSVPVEIEGLSTAISQDFLLEYPVFANAYRLANEVFYEEAKAVFLGSSQIDEFSQNVMQKRSEMGGF